METLIIHTDDGEYTYTHTLRTASLVEVMPDGKTLRLAQGTEIEFSCPIATINHGKDQIYPVLRKAVVKRPDTVTVTRTTVSIQRRTGILLERRDINVNFDDLPNQKQDTLLAAATKYVTSRKEFFGFVVSGVKLRKDTKEEF